MISNYASNAGKSGGEFFTPQTVSKLLAKLVMDGKTSIKRYMIRDVGNVS
ncbi:N-6 DNA methylase [Finegoldia magna]|nr:N-6 DNA methylase [Finegoldia magna]